MFKIDRKDKLLCLPDIGVLVCLYCVAEEDSKKKYFFNKNKSENIIELYGYLESLTEKAIVWRHYKGHVILNRVVSWSKIYKEPVKQNTNL